MAAGDKKKIKAELKVYPLKEMTKEARDFISNSKELAKKYGPIVWSKDIMVDPRKWTKKSLADGMAAVARYDMKILCVRVAEAAKAEKNGKGEKDQKKTEKELSKSYEEIKKEILDKVSLAIDEVEADKGDNAKNLKDCKAAFGKLEKVDFDWMYKGPRQSLLETFEGLAEELADEPDEKRVAKVLGQCADWVAEAIAGFKENGKEATEAVDTLLKAAKTTKANKGAAPELIAYAEKVLKQEGKISSVLAKSKSFSDALDTAQKLVKSGTVTANQAKLQVAIFKKLSRLDNSAKDTLSAAKKLKPEFQKIEKSLK